MEIYRLEEGVFFEKNFQKLMCAHIFAMNHNKLLFVKYIIFALLLL